MTNPTYVACTFRPGDARAYTYHWDGEPLAPGDEVKVTDKSGDGWKRVYVKEVDLPKPPYPTKPILEKIVPEKREEALL